MDQVQAEVAEEELLAEARELPLLLAGRLGDLPGLLLADLGRHVSSLQGIKGSRYILVPALRTGEACSLDARVQRVIAAILAVGRRVARCSSAPAPGYDPWAWLLWGREVAGGALSTVEGPAFKPLPVAVCALLAPLGGAAPWLWVRARAGRRRGRAVRSPSGSAGELAGGSARARASLAGARRGCCGRRSRCSRRRGPRRRWCSRSRSAARAAWRGGRLARSRSRCAVGLRAAARRGVAVPAALAGVVALARGARRTAPLLRALAAVARAGGVVRPGAGSARATCCARAPAPASRTPASPRSPTCPRWPSLRERAARCCCGRCGSGAACRRCATAAPRALVPAAAGAAWIALVARDGAGRASPASRATRCPGAALIAISRRGRASPLAAAPVRRPRLAAGRVAPGSLAVVALAALVPRAARDLRRRARRPGPPVARWRGDLDDGGRARPAAATPCSPAARPYVGPLPRPADGLPRSTCPSARSSPTTAPRPPGVVFRSRADRRGRPAPAGPAAVRPRRARGDWQVLRALRPRLGCPNMLPRRCGRARHAAPSSPLALGRRLRRLRGPRRRRSTSLEPPAPATESGRAHHFDVARIADGLNRPTWVGAAPGDDARCGCSSSRAASSASTDGRRTIAARPRRPRQARAPSRACSASPSTPTSPPTAALYLHWSDRSGDTRVAEFRARRDGTHRPASRCASCCSSTSPRRTTTAASSRSAPTAASTSGSATAAARSTRAAPRRTPDTLLGKLVAADVDGREPGWERRADRPAQPVALLVRPGARRDLDRRRRPGRRRGGRPRAARARRAAQEPRLERVRGHRAASERPRPRPRRASSSGPSRTYAHARRLLGHRRRRLRAAPRCPSSTAATSTATSAPGALWSLRGTPEGRADGRPPRAAPRSRSSPTSAPTTDGELRLRLGRRRALPRGAGRLRLADRRRARSPARRARRARGRPGARRGSPSRRLRSRSPLRSSRCTSWSWP